MAYSDFTLDRVKKEFDLTLDDQIDIFADVPELECSEFLAAILRENRPFALASNYEIRQLLRFVNPL